ncbi:MAG: gliding motility-associated C-terminal domain-containing protein [Brumimicrobium sp.]|nr:gliding motility-associated C-terminal domain-containing protein [Brumimicrobium sp.]
MSKLTLSQIVPESENLVPNGSFEEYEECPLGIADFSVSEWFSATWGTPDYFNVCNSDYLSTGIPLNFIGYQYPKDGDAYVGLGLDFNVNPTFREYIQVHLKHPLDSQKIYEFSCFINKADDPSVCTTNLGFLFSEDSIGGDVNQILHEVQYTNTNSFITCDEENWSKINFIFEAQGGEKFLTIGFFDLDNHLDTVVTKYSIYGVQSYYYIDKVSLVATNFTIPNVYTPNNDGVNDVLTIKGVPEGFNFTILNRWGNVVFETNNSSHEFWDGTYDGNRCTDGVYFYTLVKDDFKKSGFIHLVR